MSGRTPSSLAEPAPAVGRTALVGARVLTDGGWTEPATVVLDGGRIAEVRPGGSAPDQVPVVDLTGRYLVPGLIDAHAHLSILDARSTGPGRRTARSRCTRHSPVTSWPRRCAAPSGPG